MPVLPSGVVSVAVHPKAVTIAQHRDHNPVGDVITVTSEDLVALAALVAEAAGADRVWWCRLGRPPADCVAINLDYDSHPTWETGKPLSRRCGWRWLLPATAPEEDNDA